MWPDPKSSGRMQLTSSLAAKSASFTRRRRRERSFWVAAGKRRCVVESVSVVGFGALGRVFVAAASPPPRTPGLRVRVLQGRGSMSGAAALGPSVGGYAASVAASREGQQLRVVQSPSFGVGLAGEPVGGQKGQLRRGPVAGTHNKQMQRARIHYKFVLCLGHRRVADLRRSAATMRYRALSDSASTRAEESDSESAESRQKR
jgi:hypothetical protein